MDINNQRKKTKIFGEANEASLLNALEKYKLSDCFFLIDIEGYEYQLLNKNIINKLSEAVLLVELHKSREEGLRLIKSLEDKFDVKEFTTGARDLSKFQFLNILEDNDRWLSVSEHRSDLMSWIICKPKI